MSMTGGGIYPDMHDQSEPLKILVISCDSLASKKKAAMIRNHPNVHASRYFEGRSWGCAGLDAPCGFGVRWVRLVRVGQCGNGLKLRPAQQKTCQLLYTVLRARTSMPNPSMSRQRRFASTRNHYIMDYYCTIWHVICIDVSYPMLINVVPTVSGTCHDSAWFCSQYTRANTTTSYLARKVLIFFKVLTLTISKFQFDLFRLWVKSSMQRSHPKAVRLCWCLLFASLESNDCGWHLSYSMHQCRR